MVKDTTLQGSTTNLNNDQDHGCCGVLKNPFRKRNTGPKPIPPEPIARSTAPPANQHKHVEPDVTPTPGVQEGPEVITIPDDNPVPKNEDPSQTSKEEEANAKFRNAKEQDEHVEPDVNPTPEIQEEPQVITTPEDSPVPKDEDPSQTSREEKANARFRNAKEQLEKVISKPNTLSPIELSFLKSNEIGNVSQMARDIELAISEFLDERDQRSQKGKETAMKWIHKVSFAGQKILGTAESVASVSSIANVTESRNSSHRQLAVWFLVLLDTF
jgi:hypothetical protein